MADRKDHRLVELLYDEVSSGTDRASLRDALRRDEGEGRDLAELEETLGLIRSVPDDDPPPILDAKILAEARRAAEMSGSGWSRWLRALMGPTSGVAVAGAVAACAALFLLPTLPTPATRLEGDIEPYAAAPAPHSPAVNEAEPAPRSSAAADYRPALAPASVDDEGGGRQAEDRRTATRRRPARRRLRSGAERDAALASKPPTEDKPRAVFDMPAKSSSARREAGRAGESRSVQDADALAPPSAKKAFLAKSGRKDKAKRTADALGSSSGRGMGADGMIAGGAKEETPVASKAVPTARKPSAPRPATPAPSAKGEGAARSAGERARVTGALAAADEPKARRAAADPPRPPAAADEAKARPAPPAPPAAADEPSAGAGPADRPGRSAPRRPMSRSAPAGESRAPAEQPAMTEASGKADARLPSAVRAARAQLAVARREVAKGRPALARAAFERAVTGLRRSQPRVAEEEGRALVRYAEFELGQARYDRARVLAQPALTPPLDLRGFTGRKAAERVIERAKAAAR